MRDPDQQSSNSFKLVLGMLIGVTIGQAALADSDELAATQDEPISTDELVAAPLTGPHVYNNVCIACHQPDGMGIQGIYLPLNNNPLLTGEDPTYFDRLAGVARRFYQGDFAGFLTELAASGLRG